MKKIKEVKEDDDAKVEHFILEEDEVNDFFVKEKKKGYNQTYYNKHKIDLLEKMKVKEPCHICDKLISKTNLRRHRRKCDENRCVKREEFWDQIKKFVENNLKK